MGNVRRSVMWTNKEKKTVYIYIYIFFENREKKSLKREKKCRK